MQSAIRWYKSLFAQTLISIEDHFSKYRISDALMTLYKLIWDDFCSWFLEMIKPAYGHPIDLGTLIAIKSIFEENLKLLHPFMPFLTEELWHFMQKRKKEDALIISRWPKVGQVNKQLINDFEIVKHIISGIRNFRNEKNIGFKEQLILISDSEIPYLEVVKKLGQIKKLGKKVDYNKKNIGSFRVGKNEYLIPTSEFVDTEAEKKKVMRELEYAKGFLKSVKKKLSNESFLSNAPKKLVELERKKVVDARQKIALLEKADG